VAWILTAAVSSTRLAGRLALREDRRATAAAACAAATAASAAAAVATATATACFF